MLTRTYDAVVAGSGPAGVAVVGALLHFNKDARIAWLDPDFGGGRLSKRYRDVSSNTKTDLFLQYATALDPFRQVIDSAPTPNAITKMQSLDQNKGCRLHYAADVVSMLINGLRDLPNVDSHFAKLTTADYNPTSSSWTLGSQHRAHGVEQRDITFEARRLILTTGSAPTSISLPTDKSEILDLDTAIDRSQLRRCLPNDEPITVGVIGTSHSAIVIIMNLFELATTTHLRLKIKWFVRSDLSYAKEMDGWILRDNTGLKGLSADFARQHLEPDQLAQSPVGKVLSKVNCPDASDESMRSELETCQYLVEAIGFHRDPLPQINLDGSSLDTKKISYDPESGRLKDSDEDFLPSAFGAGIAFPERVTDPAGNTEYAVGLWKFMKYLKRVVPDWS